VDEDGEREACAEPHAIESPIDAEEGEEAEEEFEFEDEEEGGLKFCEDDEDGRERAEAFGPPGLWRGLGVCGIDTPVEGADALLNRVGLLRGAREPGESREPEFAGLGELAELVALFEVACGFRDLLDVAAVDEGGAVWTGKCACS